MLRCHVATELKEASLAARTDAAFDALCLALKFAVLCDKFRVGAVRLVEHPVQALRLSLAQVMLAVPVRAVKVLAAVVEKILPVLPRHGERHATLEALLRHKFLENRY
jgi:hypothetical protein